MVPPVEGARFRPGPFFSTRFEPAWITGRVSESLLPEQRLGLGHCGTGGRRFADGQFFKDHEAEWGSQVVIVEDPDTG